ncbi:MAG: Maf family protein [Synergistaceae bacterium]
MDGEKIILASASPRRKDLLETIGVEFEVCPSDVAEDTWYGEAPHTFVMSLAKVKAENVAQRNCGKWILAADTVVVCDNNILEKPIDYDDALRMIKMLQGRVHSVLTGVAVISPSKQILLDYEQTDVSFCKLSPKEIEAYVSQGESLDKAGAYAVQGKGSLLVEKIDGCYSNVVGLPINKVAKMFEKLGFSFFDNWRRNLRNA